MSKETYTSVKRELVLHTRRYEAPRNARIDAVIGVARSDAATIASTIGAMNNVCVRVFLSLVRARSLFLSLSLARLSARIDETQD